MVKGQARRRCVVEELERRRLLSAGGVGVALADGAAESAVFMPLAKAKMPNLVGQWSGTGRASDGQKYSVLLTVSKQGTKGQLTATMIASKKTYKLSGAVQADRTVKLSWKAKGGSGKMWGSVSTNGRALSGQFQTRDDVGTTTGTMILKKK